MNPSRVWFLSLLAAGSAVAAAGCHDLELAQLRCSLNGPCPSGYACGGDGFCRRQLGDNGRVAGPPGSKKQGEACGAADECVTHNCADGVCCDTACGDACTRLQPSRERRQLRRDRPRTALRPRRLRQAARHELRHHRALRRRRAVPALRRHHGLRRRSLREGQQHLLPRGALRRSRVLRRRRRRPVVRAVHVQAGRQGLRRPLRRPDRVRVAQPLQQRIVRHDRQRPALPQRRPVPVRLLCRRRLLQRTLHGTVHGMRSDRVARNLRAGRGGKPARRARHLRRRGNELRRTVHGGQRHRVQLPGRREHLSERHLHQRRRERLADHGGRLRRRRLVQRGRRHRVWHLHVRGGRRLRHHLRGRLRLRGRVHLPGRGLPGEGRRRGAMHRHQPVRRRARLARTASAARAPAPTLAEAAISADRQGTAWSSPRPTIRIPVPPIRAPATRAEPARSRTSRPARPPPTARAERARPSIQTLTATRSAIAARPSPTARRSRSAAPPARAG